MSTIVAEVHYHNRQVHFLIFVQFLIVVYSVIFQRLWSSEKHTFLAPCPPCRKSADIAGTPLCYRLSPTPLPFSMHALTHRSPLTRQLRAALNLNSIPCMLRSFLNPLESLAARCLPRAHPCILACSEHRHKRKQTECKTKYYAPSWCINYWFGF